MPEPSSKHRAQPRIVARESTRVACLRYVGPAGEPIGRFWSKTVRPWLGDYGLIDCPRFGVALDDPARTPPEQCRYDACVQLPPSLEIPGSTTNTIAGGRYAVLTFKGTAAQIAGAWAEFSGPGLTQAAYLVDSARRPFEYYPRGASHDAKTGTFACELCIPVV